MPAAKRLVGPVPACTEKGDGFGFGTVQGRGPHNAAGVQRDRDRGPVPVAVLVHAAQRDDDATRGGIGEAPEPALHFAPMRRHWIAEGHISTGAPIGIDQ